MKAAVLEEYHKDFIIRELEVPSPKRDEVLVKVRASGICGTDLHIQDGRLSTIKLPHIPGHEIAGEVWAVGEEVKGFDKGDAVIVAIDIICNNCRYCQTGRGNLCNHLVRIGFERNGGHEEYVVVPSPNLIKFDKKVPYEKAAIIPDAVACMYHAIKNQGKVRATDKVCILGVGGLGFQGIQIAKYFGAEVYCTSRKDEKLRIADAFGSNCSINTEKQDLFETIKEKTLGEMCDVVFDNIGNEKSIQASLDICRPGGKVIMVGYSKESFRANYQSTAMKEKEIIGIRGSNRRDIIEVTRLVEAGVIDPFVTKTYPLEEINLAMQDLRQGKSPGRTVLVMND